MKKNAVRRKMGKISLIMVFTSIVIASGFSAYDYIRENNRLKEDFNEMLAPVSGRLVSNLKKLVWFDDKTQALQVLKSEMDNKRIYAIVIREADKALFCGAQRNDAWEIIESQEKNDAWEIIESQEKIAGDFVVKKEDIFNEEEDMPIGTVELFFTTRFIDESLKKLVFYMIAKVLLMSVLLVSVFLLIVNFFLIKPIYKAVRTLGAVGSEIGSVSERVASVGLELTDGASKQATSVEETSSSLEEITSMSRLNTENISHANTLMIETSRVVNEAGDSMKELVDSIDELSKTSEETRKVIKVIEKIAFQINLLSMNAAVEAVHAGQAGAGFGVIVQEVRNLALRSRASARDTAALIEASIERTKHGVDLVYKAGETFENVATGAKKVGELLGEVTISSQEQVRGIGNINEAMTEIDKVTQKNAANAEETASVIQEIEGQTKRMKTVVTELVALIGNPSAGSGTASAGSGTASAGSGAASAGSGTASAGSGTASAGRP